MKSSAIPVLGVKLENEATNEEVQVVYYTEPALLLGKSTLKCTQHISYFVIIFSMCCSSQEWQIFLYSTTLLSMVCFPFLVTEQRRLLTHDDIPDLVSLSYKCDAIHKNLKILKCALFIYSSLRFSLTKSTYVRDVILV